MDRYPAVEETAIFGTSRVSLTRQSLSCDITDPSCDYQTVGSEIVAYIADIGNFTVCETAPVIVLHYRSHRSPNICALMPVFSDASIIFRARLLVVVCHSGGY